MNCNCRRNESCRSSFAIYEVDENGSNSPNVRIGYVLPGIVSSCYLIDSVLYSTLECFYSNSNCTSIILKYISKNNYRYNDYPQWIDIAPLHFNSTKNRFPPHSSIESLLKEMLVEEWNPSIRYEDYYEGCSPVYCTYNDRSRRKSGISLVISLMSFIGGLCSSLNIVSPYLVQLCYSLSKLISRRRLQSNEEGKSP